MAEVLSRPVILLHAPEIGGSSGEWAPLTGYLAEGRTVMAPDLLGFGESVVPDEAPTAAALVDQVVALVDRTGPCHLVGRAQAAAYAVVAAASRPETVRSLAVIGPRGIHPTVARPELYDHFAAAPAGRRRYEALLEELRSWLAGEVFLDPERVTDQLVNETWRRAARPGAERVFGALAAGWLDLDVRAEWVALTQPILLLWGEACEDPPLDEVDDWLMPLRPNAPFMMINRRPIGVWKQSVTYKSFAARQRPQVEQAEAVAEVLLDHLRAADGQDGQGPDGGAAVTPAVASVPPT